MNLSVDASVAVKWFVSEPLSENARLLLAHRLDLYAPDILLVVVLPAFFAAPSAGIRMQLVVEAYAPNHRLRSGGGYGWV